MSENKDAALRGQPEARGVVDGAPAFQRWSMARGSDGKRWSVYMDHDQHGEWVKWVDVQQHFFGLALTDAQQPVQEGGGEVCPRCKGAGEYEGFARHASGDPQDEYAATVQCEPCEGTGEVAAPPSAPVGVELDAAALGRFAQDEWMDRNSAYPAWGRLTEAEQAAWLAVGERIKRVVSLAQQPAQAAPGEFVVIDGRSYALDTVRTALLGLAADVAATPPGDDAAGGRP